MCVCFVLFFVWVGRIFIHKTTFTHTVSSRLIIHCVGVGVGVCCLKKSTIYENEVEKNATKKSMRRESI